MSKAKDISHHVLLRNRKWN